MICVSGRGTRHEDPLCFFTTDGGVGCDREQLHEAAFGQPQSVHDQRRRSKRAGQPAARVGPAHSHRRFAVDARRAGQACRAGAAAGESLAHRWCRYRWRVDAGWRFPSGRKPSRRGDHARPRLLDRAADDLHAGSRLQPDERVHEHRQSRLHAGNGPGRHSAGMHCADPA